MSSELEREAQQLSVISSLPPERILRLLYLWQEGYGNPFIASYRKEWTGGLGETELEKLQETFAREQAAERLSNEFRSQASRQGATDAAVMDFSARANAREVRILGPLLLTLSAHFGPQPSSLASEIPPGKGSSPHWAEGTTAPPPGGPAEKIWGQMAAATICNLDLFRGLVRTARNEGTFQIFREETASPPPARFSPWIGSSLPIAQVPSEALLLGEEAERQNLAKVIFHVPEDRLSVLIEEAFPDLVGPLPGTETGEKILRLYLREPIVRILKAEMLDRAQGEWVDRQCEEFLHLLHQTQTFTGKIAGVHPDYRSGCAVVVIDEKGILCDQVLLRPHESLKQRETSRGQLAGLIGQHQISLVAIGNAPACQDMKSLIEEAITLLGEEGKKPDLVVISEAGKPTVGGKSEEGVSLSPCIGLALNVARRAQNPLTELVKTDPVLLVNSQILAQDGLEKLRLRLRKILTSHVSAARVNLNEAPASLLRYVCGLDESTAEQIVEYRNRHGRFSSRWELLEIPEIHGRVFEQAAGFLQIPGGDNPLDNSAIHPESYFVVRDLCSRLNISLDSLLTHPELLAYFQPEDFVTREAKIPTINDIFTELARL